MNELKSLTRMGGDLRKIARLLQDKGRKGDTILAHINPREAALLREHGGSGTTNPETGLMEFYEDDYGNPLELSAPQTPAFDTQGYEGVTLPETVSGPPAVSGIDLTSQPSEFISTEDFRLPAGRLSTQTGAPAFDVSRVAPDVGSSYQLSGRDYSLAKAGVPEATEKPEKGILDSLSGGDKLRLGLGLAGGVQTALTARKAREGAQKYAQQIREIGAPYQQKGLAEQAAASRGELNAVGQQQLEAQRARAAQAGVARGGVGVAQQQRAEEDLRQRLLAAQQDFGLKLSGIGDQYTAKAIQEGIRADAEISAMYGNYFSNLTRLAAPTIIQSNQPAKG